MRLRPATIIPVAFVAGADSACRCHTSRRCITERVPNGERSWATACWPARAPTGGYGRAATPRASAGLDAALPRTRQASKMNRPLRSQRAPLMVGRAEHETWQASPRRTPVVSTHLGVVRAPWQNPSLRPPLPCRDAAGVGIDSLREVRGATVRARCPLLGCGV
jgi:hypothetical protein